MNELPMDAVRFLREEFRLYHSRYLDTRDSRLQSRAHQAIWEVRQIRRANPRRKVRHVG